MPKRMIWLAGDSISKGYALGAYSEQIIANGPSDPRYAILTLASISSMANNVLYENGIRDEFSYSNLPSVNLSSDLNDTISQWRGVIANGTVRSGDVVVAEDAGPNSQDPDAYQAQWLAFRTAIVDRFDITLVMMNMFSYSTTDPTSRYDVPVGPTPQRTINAATAAAYAATVPNERGQTLWMDMKGIIDAWKASAKSVDNVDVILPDGIHPNVWGQAMMTGEILKALRYRPYLNTCNQLATLAANNDNQLHYGSGTFNSARAAAYMTNCVLR